MKNKGQLESLIISIVYILLFLSLVIYYFQFKTGSVPVFKTKKNIEPAERGVLPRGTFFDFEKNKPKEKLPYLFLNKVYAQSKVKYKPNKNLETSIINPLPLTILENNIFDLVVSGQNKKNPLERIYFEYKIEPIHTEWQKLYGQQRRFSLPKGTNFYTIYVRAINKNYEIDPTPAVAYLYTNISPFYQDISIDINFKKDQIILKNKSKNQINLTGWRIISSRANFFIPQAVKDIPPDLNIKLENILLNPGERAIIYSNLYNSPLGYNFKLNKCFKYLAESRGELKPYLKNFVFPCERLTKQQLLEIKYKYRLSNNCLNILEKIPCSGPKPQDWLKIDFDSSCYRFFENNYTYQGCYQNRKNDSNFYLKDWFIFIPDITTFTQNKYDEIKIYDQRGLLVNKKVIY